MIEHIEPDTLRGIDTNGNICKVVQTLCRDILGLFIRLTIWYCATFHTLHFFFFLLDKTIRFKHNAIAAWMHFNCQ